MRLERNKYLKVTDVIEGTLKIPDVASAEGLVGAGHLTLRLNGIDVLTLRRAQASSLVRVLQTYLETEAAESA